MKKHVVNLWQREAGHRAARPTGPRRARAASLCVRMSAYAPTHALSIYCNVQLYKEV